ncbi:MAG: heparan-alpha-glucosaminide N-acetyltransferase domain-containing protein, partial [Dethiobacteria bacterium]
MSAKKSGGGKSKKRGGAAPEEKRFSLKESARSLFLEPVDIISADSKPPRIDELDLLRGYAIFGFIIYHAVLLLGSEAVVYDSLLGFISYIIFWAPVGGKAFFQIYIGIYLVYARSSTQTIIKRGLTILAAGYALNALRFLPVIIGVSRGTLRM